MILVDSNILIDLFAPEQSWQPWSAQAVAEAGAHDILAINAIVVAEVAPRLTTLDDFLTLLGGIGIEIIDFPTEAAFTAGTIFQSYRTRRKEAKSGSINVLPDFFIGGHAASAGASILTRDPRFYRTYFPDVPLITPSKEYHD